MPKKIIEIETCTGCPFFNDAYVSWGMTREWCRKENKGVPWNAGTRSYPIPDFCTLENAEDYTERTM